jgi:hypothetical protein
MPSSVQMTDTNSKANIVKNIEIGYLKIIIFDKNLGPMLKNFFAIVS